MRFTSRLLPLLLTGALLGAVVPTVGIAQPTAPSVTTLVGKHPAELTRHPDTLAALRQSLGPRYAAGRDLLQGVASGVTLVAGRYIVGQSMAPHSGGDQSIFVAYDTVVGVAYLIAFDAGQPPANRVRFDVYGPTAGAPWPQSLWTPVASWRPGALPFLTFTSDGQAAQAAGPRPTPMAPPPRQWGSGFGQGTLEVGITNDAEARITFACPSGAIDKTPSLSLSVRANVRVPGDRLLPISVIVDGVDRAGGLRLTLSSTDANGIASLWGRMPDARSVEALKSLAEAIRSARTLEVRVPDIRAVETFSVVNADRELRGALSGCDGPPAPPPVASAPPPARPGRIGPGFDCGRPNAQRDALAQLICLDDGLARLDLAFVQAFQALRHQVGEAGARDLRREAVEFGQGVVRQCGLPTAAGPARSEVLRPARGCVEAAYSEQRRVWISRLSPIAREEAERLLERHIAMQRMLQELGHIPATSTVDGIYGPATRTAIAAWQRTAGVQETGLLGANDAASLEATAVAARPPASRPAPAPQETPPQAVAAPPQPAPAPPPPPRPSTTPIGSGTAFVVRRSDGLLLTNAHVVDGCGRLAIASGAGATVVARDNRRDLALVRAEGSFEAQARFRRDQTVDLGETVYAFGFPLYGFSSTALNLTNGIVSALVGLNDNPAHFQLNAAIQPGNSGGPVVDSSGAVLGVAVARLSDRAVLAATGTVPQAVNFAIRGQLAESFLLEQGVMVEKTPTNATARDLREVAHEMGRVVHPIFCYGSR
jgi:S1-C subfamily serine protease